MNGTIKRISGQILNTIIINDTDWNILKYLYKDNDRINIRNIVETDYTIHTEKNIREEGYRVAMISDLHYGMVLHIH